MPRLLITMVVAFAFVVVLVLYAVTYTVRFTETAVVTRFGEVSRVVTSPGLEAKWFYPVDSVIKYDTRSRLTQAKIETYQTRDDRQLIVGAFAIWRVRPEAADTFYRRFSNSGPRSSDHYEAAATLVEDTLRSAMSELSAFSMDELFTPDEALSKLDELEERVLAQMQSTLEGQGDRSFGIDVVETGIGRILLPQSTTEAALERMRQDRARLVTELEEKGSAEAQAIRSTAEANAAKIRQFATARAKQIRALGEAEAAEYLAQMTEAPELAVFLKKLDSLSAARFGRTTLLFSTATPGLDLLDPGLFESVPPGEIPGIEAFMDPKAEAMEVGMDGREAGTGERPR